MHNDLVVSHINDLEGIKAAVISKEHYEAAEVITKSVSLIKSTHIENEYLANENKVLKQNLRIHIASMAMQGILAGGEGRYDKIAKKAFVLTDEMMAMARKETDDGKKKEECKAERTGDGVGSAQSEDKHTE